MANKMNMRIGFLAAAFMAADVVAQVPPGPAAQGDVSASTVQAQQRRGDMRQAVASQGATRDPGATSQRRLSPEEKAELRQQVRLHGRPAGEGAH